MIYYFSATGNTRYVAQKIADEIGDRATSIVGLGKCVCTDEVVGICSPTYCTGLAHIVEEFLKNLQLNGVKYFFILTTYGTFTDVNYKKFTPYKPDALFSIKFPDNATWIFDLSDSESVQNTLNKSKIALNEVIDKIKDRKVGSFIQNRAPILIRNAYHLMLKGERKTRHFSVDENCIGCGLCEKSCPVSAIKLNDKKPTWVTRYCEMCLSCLHHCPKFAIHRGKNTSRHGQYDIKKYDME